jgi:hypothetical protein
LNFIFIYSFFLAKKNQKFNPPAGGQLQSFSHSKCLRNAAEKPTLAQSSSHSFAKNSRTITNV